MVFAKSLDHQVSVSVVEHVTVIVQSSSTRQEAPWRKSKTESDMHYKNPLELENYSSNF